jgi:hypothetical protein
MTEPICGIDPITPKLVPFLRTSDDVDRLRKVRALIEQLAEEFEGLDNAEERSQTNCDSESVSEKLRGIENRGLSRNTSA